MELLKIKQQKNKVVVGLWKTSQNYEVKFCHSREKDWIDINKETRTYFAGRINEELGSFISTINSNNP